MSDSIKCPHCEEYIPEKAKFCPECGRPIQDEVPKFNDKKSELKGGDAPGRNVEWGNV